MVAAGQQAVVFLMGPTASGKTAMAARIQDEFASELVSVDAAQIYRGMDIGTAKPDPGFLARHPHHLIDILDPDETWSAAEFRRHATALIDSIISRNHLPVLVGGTMFYFSTVENGLSTLPAADAKTRIRVRNEIERQGLQSVYHQLARIDPGITRGLAPTDSHRIQRATEIYRLTGMPPSDLANRTRRQGLNRPIIKIALFTGDRKVLHKRVEARFEGMLERGLVAEVERLLANPDYSPRLPSMRCAGYRQVAHYLCGDIDYRQMAQSAIAATRQLAKRQLTWLRNQSNVVWFDMQKAGMSDAILAYLRAHPLTMDYNKDVKTMI